MATLRAEDNARLAQEMTALAASESKAKEDAEASADAAEERTKEIKQLLEFQQSLWTDIDIELMGTKLRRSLLSTVQEESRATVEAGLQGVNFTGLALQMLDENVFGLVPWVWFPGSSGRGVVVVPTACRGEALSVVEFCSGFSPARWRSWLGSRVPTLECAAAARAADVTLHQAKSREPPARWLAAGVTGLASSISRSTVATVCASEVGGAPD